MKMLRGVAIYPMVFETFDDLTKRLPLNKEVYNAPGFFSARFLQSRQFDGQYMQRTEKSAV